MAVIGIDSHKDTLACCAVDAAGGEIAARAVSAIRQAVPAPGRS